MNKLHAIKLFTFSPIVRSPSVEGSWRFAHIDVIPATGIMAFGE